MDDALIEKVTKTSEYQSQFCNEYADRLAISTIRATAMIKYGFQSVVLQLFIVRVLNTDLENYPTESNV